MCVNLVVFYSAHLSINVDMKVVMINIYDPKDFKEVILSYEFINACSAYITGETSTEENTKTWLRILVYTVS